MAQIRSKQIADFLNTVNFSLLSTDDKTKIANAADTKLYIDAQVSGLSGSATASIDSLEVALSAEISATNSDVLRTDIAVTAIQQLNTAQGASIDSLEVALSAEISATNSDVLRTDIAVTAIQQLNTAQNASIDSLETALAAEISATNSDVLRTDIAVTAIETLNTAQGASIDSLETALAAEISATNADVTGINLSVDSLETLAGTLATKSSVDTRATAIETLNTAQGASIDSLEVALSAEIVATNSDVTRIDGNVSTEKARIDAILLAADADKNTFVEIVSLINAVDLTSDNAFAAYVTSNNAALSAEIVATNADFTSVNTRATNIETLNTAQGASIDSLEVALSAEISATNSDVLRTDIAVTAIQQLNTAHGASIDSLEVALAAEISATNSDVLRTDIAVTAIQQLNTAHGASIDSLEVALAAEITATNSDVTRIDAKDLAQDGRLTALEGYIMEDAEQFVESFTGSGLTYTVANSVQDDNVALVNVFINGHRANVSTVVGAVITLVNPGYTIDADDSIVINYQAV